MRYRVAAAFLVCVLSLPAQAQVSLGEQPKTEQKKAYSAEEAPITMHGTSVTAGPRYMALARRAIAKHPDDFDFAGFRIYYSETEWYDPVATDICASLTGLAFRLQEENDTAKRRAIVEKYGNILVEHMGNIDVVTQALSLARQNRALGDPKFLKWMRAGLLASVVNTGNGTSLNNAYDVLTLGEETALLYYLNVRILDTAMRESGGVYYNIHETENKQTGQQSTIFVDATKPLAYLQEREKADKARINVPKR